MIRSRMSLAAVIVAIGGCGGGAIAPTAPAAPAATATPAPEPSAEPAVTLVAAAPTLEAATPAAPAASPRPSPKATARPTIQTEFCGGLPPLETLRGWPVQRICGPGSSFAGPPPPGGHRFVEPRRLLELGDGTFITERKDRGCYRAEIEVCHNKCLPAGTLIATPAGDVPVRDLTSGLPIWTRNARGERVAGRVLQTQHVPAVLAHVLVRVGLADGRIVSASVGHPLAHGPGIETLVRGSRYDGSTVVSTERVPADSGGTYDLLPSGDTGVYWADGIALGSTLWGSQPPERTAASSP